MMLRNAPENEQSLADGLAPASFRYAGSKARRTANAKIQRGLGLECVSTIKRFPSFDGQQSSPSVALPVFFRPRAPSHIIASTAQALGPCGDMRFQTHRHHHKGPAYVQ